MTVPSIYPCGLEHVPHRAAIFRANRSMLDRCTFLIAYAWHPAGNARSLLDYARSWERRGPVHVTCLERGLV